MPDKRTAGHKKRFITRDKTNDDIQEEKITENVDQLLPLAEQQSNKLLQHNDLHLSQQAETSLQQLNSFSQEPTADIFEIRENIVEGNNFQSQMLPQQRQQRSTTPVPLSQQIDQHVSQIHYRGQQLAAPHQQRKHVARSPSLNSPRTGRRLSNSRLTPQSFGEFSAEANQSSTTRPPENLAAKAPRSPRPLQRANTERMLVGRNVFEQPSAINLPQPTLQRHSASPNRPTFQPQPQPQRYGQTTYQQHGGYVYYRSTPPLQLHSVQQSREEQPLQTPPLPLLSYDVSQLYQNQLQQQQQQQQQYRTQPQLLQQPGSSRASAESDSSSNRFHPSVVHLSPLSDPYQPQIGSPTTSVTQQFDESTFVDNPLQHQSSVTRPNNTQASNRFEQLQLPQHQLRQRSSSRSPIPPGSYRFSPSGQQTQLVPNNRSSAVSEEATRYVEPIKIRSSSLTDSVTGAQLPAHSDGHNHTTTFDYQVTKAPLHRCQQNQSFDSCNLNDRTLKNQLSSLKPRNSLESDFILNVSDGAANLRSSTESSKMNDSPHRRSFYDNASTSPTAQQQIESGEPLELFPAAGETWKSQTAPSSLSIFKRPAFGRVAQVIPPHLVGVFDPGRYLPFRRSSSRTSAPGSDTLQPSDILSDNITSSLEAKSQQQGRPNEPIDDPSCFRYSDPVQIQDQNFPKPASPVIANFYKEISDVKEEEKSDIALESSSDPRQLNQFLSLSSGPWSKEKSLFGRANTAKETKKVETNWKKFEEYQKSPPPLSLFKGQTQKQLDEHVELLEKVKHLNPQGSDSVSAYVDRLTVEPTNKQRAGLSRSHDSIDSSHDHLKRSSQEHSASSKARSQDFGSISNGHNKRFPVDSLLGNTTASNNVSTDFRLVAGDKSHLPAAQTTCVSIKQVTLNVPEKAEGITRSPTLAYCHPSRNSDPGASIAPQPLYGLNTSAAKLHTSRLVFQPANSMSPKPLRREMQLNDRQTEVPKHNLSTSSDFVAGLQKADNERKAENKYITSMSIPESELFKPLEAKPHASLAAHGDKTSMAKALGHQPFSVVSGTSQKPIARRTHSDAVSHERPFARHDAPRSAHFCADVCQEGDTTSYFIFPSLSGTPKTSSAADSDDRSNHTASSAGSAKIDVGKDTKIQRPQKLESLCKEFLDDTFDLELKSPLSERLPENLSFPTQSSELTSSSSSSSFSMGDSSFAAFCLQQQQQLACGAAELPLVSSDRAKTPTNTEELSATEPQLFSRATNAATTVVATTPTNQLSAVKKISHPLTKQDSFNSPDSPLFHKTLPLPKDSVILHHRRHQLKECASFQSTSSSSEDSDIENFSALRLTPKKPRRTKARVAS